jgi:hypothetical protein
MNDQEARAEAFRNDAFASRSTLNDVLNDNRILRARVEVLEQLLDEALHDPKRV